MSSTHSTVPYLLFAAALSALSGCDTGRAPPARALASAAPITSACTVPRQKSAAASRLAAWEPVDAQFAGCAHTCGAGPGVNHADAREQPGAEVGDLTYCPVSGAVFRISGASSRREVNGGLLYFCCESCANYFSAHRDEVVAQRGM